MSHRGFMSKARKIFSAIVLLSMILSLSPGLILTVHAQAPDPGNPTVIPLPTQAAETNPTEVAPQPTQVIVANPTATVPPAATQMPNATQEPTQPPTGTPAAQATEKPTETPVVQVATQLATPTSQSGESGWRISTDPDSGNVRFMGSDSSNPLFGSANLGGVSAQASDVAAAFLAAFGDRFGVLNPSQDLEVVRVNSGQTGDIATHYQQLYKGVPVLGGEMIVQTDDKLNVISANGKISTNLSVDVKPSVDPAIARQTALVATAAEFPNEAPDQLSASAASLWVYDSGNIDRSSQHVTALVWNVVVSSSDKQPISEFVLVDAHDGSILLHFNQVDSALNREIYDCVPGVPVVCVPWRKEGQSKTYLSDVDNAYDYLGDVYNFYLSKFGRDSIDNHGMNLIALTGLNMANALWDGINKYFEIGHSFGVLDILGHEYTHGVTQYTSKLVSLNQSGAINESISDVFGELIDQANGESTSNKWLMGQSLPDGALRSMKDPANAQVWDYSLNKQVTEDDPDKISSSNYKCDANDNGEIHSDSGVNNKAAYLMTDGTSGEPGGAFNGQTITGIGSDKVAQIYYEAETNLMTSTTDYPDLYDDLNQACYDLYGALSFCTNTVKKALDAVEMYKEPCYGNGYILPATTLLMTPLITDAGLGPDLIWRANPVATHYQIWVKDSKNVTIYKQWQDTSICSGADCKLTFPLILYYGASYSWAVQAGNVLGNGPWSAWGRINVAAPPTDNSSPIYQNQPADGETVTTSTPTYQWYEILGASDYILTVTNKTTSKQVFSMDLQANKVCIDPTFTNCSVTPTNKLSPGSFSWVLKAKYGKAVGPSGTPTTFTVNPLPDQPQLIGPTGTIQDSLPNFSWATVDGANSYILKLSGASVNIQQEYSVSDAGCADANSSQCTVASPKVLVGGAYKWSVQARSAVGLGKVSATVTFTISQPVEKPNLNSPVITDTVTSSRPPFSWSVVDPATTYTITVQGVTKFTKTYAAASICDQKTCSVDPGVTLNPGLHTWTVKASNKAGFMISDQASFTAPPLALTPGPVILVSPSNKAKVAKSDQMAFTWDAASNATDYVLVIAGKGFSYMNTFTSSTANCGTTCTETVPGIGYGTFSWSVTAFDSGVSGKKSASYSFTTILPAPDAQPVWGVSQAKLTFTWSYQVGASRYDLLVTTADAKPKTMYKASVNPSSVCDTTTCNVTIPTFTIASYIWTISGYNKVTGNGLTLTQAFDTVPLLQSEFNNDGDWEGWDPVGTTSSVVASGKWTTVGYPNAWSFERMVSNPNTDFQAYISRHGCSACSTGIVIHGTFDPNDPNDGYLQYGYLFLINDYGYFSMWRIDNFAAAWLLPWKSSTAIKKGTAQNILRVMSNNGLFYFYINGALVWAGQDSTYADGWIGMGMYQDNSAGNMLAVDRALNYDSPDLKPLTGSMSSAPVTSSAVSNESPKEFVP